MVRNLKKILSTLLITLILASCGDAVHVTYMGAPVKAQDGIASATSFRAGQTVTINFGGGSGAHGITGMRGATSLFGDATTAMVLMKAATGEVLSAAGTLANNVLSFVAPDGMVAGVDYNIYFRIVGSPNYLLVTVAGVAVKFLLSTTGGGSTAGSPTATPTPNPSGTGTPTATSTATPSPTAVPTGSEEPTPEPIVTEEPNPTPEAIEIVPGDSGDSIQPPADQLIFTEEQAI